MYSGIGGFEKGIEQAFFQNGRAVSRLQANRSECEPNTSDRKCRGQIATSRQLVCVGFSEIDRYAISIYKRHFSEHKNYGDATKIPVGAIPGFEFLCAGFPCQAFSIAGKRKGFDDVRGTLFFEIVRILSDKRPSHFLLENVRGLLSHDSGKTVHRILRILSEVGYRVEWTVLNSKDYGVPQNRERVFFIGHLRERCEREILSFGNGSPDLVQEDAQGDDLAHTITNGEKLRGSYIKGIDKDGERKTSFALDSNYHKGAGDWKGRRQLVQVGNVDQLGHNSIWGRVYSPKGVSANLNSEGGGLGAKTGLYLKDSRIRRLTPTECERLQGFPDGWTAKGVGKEIISDTQRYKTLGNAVTVNVIEAIISEMLNKGCLE